MASIVEAAKDVMGLAKKVRYAVVALGDISQRAFMPSVQYTHNSEIVALVTSDVTKAKELAKEYNLKESDTYSYEQFDSLLQSKKIDAIYLATPNWRHAEFAVPALKAGVHVLLEKPMEVSVAKCQEILDAQKSSGSKLMIAYRLHFEPGTIAAIERVRSGELGQVHSFTAMFGQALKPENHRGQSGEAAGPLFDMGVYPLNAVRNLYGAEPIEVSAFGTKHPESGFSQDFCDTVTVNLVFPNNRLASFVVSYYINMVDEYTVAGTKGSIHVSPAFMYTDPITFAPIQVGDKQKTEKFKLTDQFAGECKYFSDLILNGGDPEPDGEEGLCDVRVVEALIKSLQNGGAPQKLAPYTRGKGVTKAQEMTISFHKQPDPKDEVNTEPPSK